MSITRSRKKRSTIAPMELVEKKGVITVKFTKYYNSFYKILRLFFLIKKFNLLGCWKNQTIKLKRKIIKNSITES